MTLTTLIATITLGTCATNPVGCYDYPSRTVILDPAQITPYVLAHELGHAVYFERLTPAERRELAVDDAEVREEEAWADTYAACVLGRGPRWMRTHGYGARVGLDRFRRICTAIRGTA